MGGVVLVFGRYGAMHRKVWPWLRVPCEMPAAALAGARGIATVLAKFKLAHSTR